MLALTEDTLVAHEPFNIEPWAYALDGLAKHWFTYAPALPQDAALEAFEKVLRRRTRKIFLKNQPPYWFPPLRRGRLIVKDPIAALSSDWLGRNFDLEVVVLVRHPAAFAASLKRLNWRHPFEHFLKQEMLMERHLDSYRAEIASRREHRRAGGDHLEVHIRRPLRLPGQQLELAGQEARGPVNQSRGRTQEFVQGPRTGVDQDGGGRCREVHPER